MSEHTERSPIAGHGGRGDIAIPYIAWEIQLTCNMGCEFCYSSSWNRFQRHDTEDRPSVKQIADGLQTLADTGLGISFINWSGGEPLLRYGDLPEILRASSQAGFNNIISTNAMFSVFPAIGHRTDRAESNRRFRAYLEREIGAHLDWLSISWDSADRATNNDVMRLAATRRRGSVHHYDDVLSVLDMYRDLKPAFNLKVNTLVSKKNYQAGVLDIGEHLRDLDAVWKLVQFNPRECPEEFRPEHWLETAEFQRVLDDARGRYEGQPGFDGLRIASRFYEGSGEPYCFLVINTSGQVLLPKGEDHVVLAQLYGSEGKPLPAERMRQNILEPLAEEVAETETYRRLSKGGQLTPLAVFSRRNLKILESSYTLDPLEFEPLRLYEGSSRE